MILRQIRCTLIIHKMLNTVICIRYAVLKFTGIFDSLSPITFFLIISHLFKVWGSLCHNISSVTIVRVQVKTISLWELVADFCSWPNQFLLGIHAFVKVVTLCERCTVNEMKNEIVYAAVLAYDSVSLLFKTDDWRHTHTHTHTHTRTHTI